jgi:hypothetical protein
MEQVTLIVLLLIMAAMVAGLFGDGPLSQTRVLTPSAGVEVSYERFARFGATMRTSINVSCRGPSTAIVLSARYLESIQVENIVPEPAAVRAVADGVEYVFAHTPGTRVRIHFAMHAIERGDIEGALTTGGERAAWRHFIYP